MTVPVLFAVEPEPTRCVAVTTTFHLHIT